MSLPRDWIRRLPGLFLNSSENWRPADRRFSAQFTNPLLFSLTGLIDFFLSPRGARQPTLVVSTLPTRDFDACG